MAGSATGVHVRSGRTRAKLQLLCLDLGFVAVALRRIKARTNQKTDREAAMRQFMMTVMALAVFGAMVVIAQAENQTPSPQDLGNDFTHPGPLWGVSQLPGTCTGLKSVCISDRMARYYGRRVYFESGRQMSRPYADVFCNFRWEQCMKTGFWEGYFQHRAAEPR